MAWKLRHLHFLYALALVSSVGNHVVDFDWQIWEEPVRCFRVSKTLTFRRHDVESMAGFLGKVWILAKEELVNETDQDTTAGGGGGRPGRIDSCVERDPAELEFQYLAIASAEQNMDETASTHQTAETGFIKGLTNPTSNPKGVNSTFQISISVSQLCALWNADIGFVEPEQHQVDREDASTRTTGKGSGRRIKRLEVGSGVILPVVGSSSDKHASKEIVCKWYSLESTGSTNVRTMVEVVGDEDIGYVFLTDLDTLLIL